MTAGQAASRGGWIPAFGWLSSHRGEWLRPDLLAAVTVWALVVPRGEVATMLDRAGLAESIERTGIHRDLVSKSPKER